MSKDAYYFSHDSNARNDHRLIAVRMKYGMRGYGIYFGIVEMLREARGYELPDVLSTIAYDLRESESDIEDIVKNYGLFTLKDGVLYSESLKNRMIELDEKRERRSTSGRIGGLQSSSNRQAIVKQCSSNAQAIVEQHSTSKVKESKVNKSKEEIKDQASPPPLKESNPPKPTDPRAVDLKGVVVEYRGQVLGEPAKHKLHNKLILLFENRGWDSTLIKSVMTACAERLSKSVVEGEVYPYYEKIIAKYINENSEMIASQNRKKRDAEFAKH